MKKIIIVSLIGLLLFSYQSVSSAQSGTLTLNVTDESGKPVEVPSVLLWVKIEGGALSFRFPTTTISPGRFLIEEIPLNKFHKLSIRQEVYAPFSFHDIEIIADENQEMTCTLVVGGTIEGIVVNDKGEPVKEIEVTVNSVECRRDVVTDESGHFKAEHLANVRYSIVAGPGKKSPISHTMIIFFMIIPSAYNSD